MLDILVMGLVIFVMFGYGIFWSWSEAGQQSSRPATWAGIKSLAREALGGKR